MRLFEWPVTSPSHLFTTNLYLHPTSLSPSFQETFLEDPGTSRAVPDWGKAIFSPLAVCMRPNTDAALAGFIQYCIALTRAHLMVGGPRDWLVLSIGRDPS